MATFNFKFLAWRPNGNLHIINKEKSDAVFINFVMCAKTEDGEAGRLMPKILS